MKAAEKVFEHELTAAAASCASPRRSSSTSWAARTSTSGPTPTDAAGSGSATSSPSGAAAPGLGPRRRRREAVDPLERDEPPNRDDRGDERLVEHLRRDAGAEVANRVRRRKTMCPADAPAITVADVVRLTGLRSEVAGADGEREEAAPADATRVPAVDADRLAA